MEAIDLGIIISCCFSLLFLVFVEYYNHHVKLMLKSMELKSVNFNDEGKIESAKFVYTMKTFIDHHEIMTILSLLSFIIPLLVTIAAYKIHKRCEKQEEEEETELKKSLIETI